MGRRMNRLDLSENEFCAEVCTPHIYIACSGKVTQITFAVLLHNALRVYTFEEDMLSLPFTTQLTLCKRKVKLIIAEALARINANL